MERRQLLQVGASLLALPLLPSLGCADPKPALAPAPSPAVAPAPPAPPASPAPPESPASPASTTASPGAPASSVASDPTSTAAPTPASTIAPAPAAAPTGAPAWGRVVGRVGRNHGHVLQVSLDDVKAGVEKTYDIAGTSSHGHAVKLTPDDFKRLRAGEIVRMPSTRDGGHLHRVYVRCAPAVDPPESVNVCATEIGGKDDHELIIPAPDMAAKVDRTYDIQGIAGHTHAVQITADDFARLARGEQLVLRTSPGDGHFHFAYIRYPASAAKAG